MCNDERRGQGRYVGNLCTPNLSLWPPVQVQTTIIITTKHLKTTHHTHSVYCTHIPYPLCQYRYSISGILELLISQLLVSVSTQPKGQNYLPRDDFLFVPKNHISRIRTKKKKKKKVIVHSYIWASFIHFNILQNNIMLLKCQSSLVIIQHSENTTI